MPWCDSACINTRIMNNSTDSSSIIGHAPYALTSWVLLLPGLLVKGDWSCPGDKSIETVDHTFEEYNVGLISFTTTFRSSRELCRFLPLFICPSTLSSYSNSRSQNWTHRQLTSPRVYNSRQIVRNLLTLIPSSGPALPAQCTD